MPSLRIIQIIHLAFCTAILLFAVTVVLVIGANATFAISFDGNDPVAIIAPIFAIVSVLLANFLFSKILENVAEEQADISSKLIRYQTSFLVKCAPLEAAALFNLVTALITQNLLFFIFAGIPFVALWLSRPTKESVSNTLQIQDTNSL